MSADRDVAIDLARAEMTARQAHGDQRDPDGSLHFDHVRAVAEVAPADCQIAAWYHDVIEDVDGGDDLVSRECSPVNYAVVSLLTYRKGESYFDDYLPRIVFAEGEVGRRARIVKTIDVLHNLNRSVAAGDGPRTFKYANALSLLVAVDPQALSEANWGPTVKRSTLDAADWSAS